MIYWDPPVKVLPVIDLTLPVIPPIVVEGISFRLPIFCAGCKAQIIPNDDGSFHHECSTGILDQLSYPR